MADKISQTAEKLAKVVYESGLPTSVLALILGNLLMQVKLVEAQGKVETKNTGKKEKKEESA